MGYSLLLRWQGSLLAASVGKLFYPQWQPQIEKWSNHYYQGVTTLAQTEQWELSGWQQYSASELALLGLPLFLFFSDQPQQWEQQIGTQQQNSLQQGVIAYGLGIQWAMQEQRFGKSLFEHLLHYSALANSHPLLKTLQLFYNQGKPLKEFQSQLPRDCHQIWLALSCFATTPDELALTVKRAASYPATTPLLTSLVGAIAGVHNSVSAIPIPWRYHLKKEQQQWKQPLEEMFATWSGSYQRAQMNPRLSAIAPAGVIQPRNHQPY